MTREEAIYRLKNTAWLGSDDDREEAEEAVTMAIKALEDIERWRIRVTEIEANAEELKMCNTLSQNLNAMLTRAFAPHTGRSTYEYEDEGESGEDGEA